MATADPLFGSTKASGRTLKVDDITGDLSVVNGQLVLIDGKLAIEQAVRSTLRFFSGEWFLDPARGVPYFENVLISNPTTNVLINTFREAILGVPGVVEITSLGLKWTKETRILEVAWQALTDEGLISSNTTVPVGG